MSFTESTNDKLKSTKHPNDDPSAFSLVNISAYQLINDVSRRLKQQQSSYDSMDHFVQKVIEQNSDVSLLYDNVETPKQLEENQSNINQSSSPNSTAIINLQQQNVEFGKHQRNIVETEIGIGSLHSKFSMLVDTGAEVSMIKSEFVNMLQIMGSGSSIVYLDKPNVALYDAQNARIEVANLIGLHIKLEDCQAVQIIFHNSPTLNVNLLLGMDQMKKMISYVHIPTSTIFPHQYLYNESKVSVIPIISPCSYQFNPNGFSEITIEIPEIHELTELVRKYNIKMISMQFNHKCLNPQIIDNQPVTIFTSGHEYFWAEGITMVEEDNHDQNNLQTGLKQIGHFEITFKVFNPHAVHLLVNKGELMLELKIKCGNPRSLTEIISDQYMENGKSNYIFSINEVVKDLEETIKDEKEEFTPYYKPLDNEYETVAAPKDWPPVMNESEVDNRVKFIKEKVSLGKDLDQSQQDEVEQLFKKFCYLFPMDARVVPLANIPLHLQFTFELTDHNPIRETVQAFPAPIEALMRVQIDKFLDHGILLKSESPYRCNARPAKRPDNTLRLCINIRKINKITIHDAYPLPRIESVLEKAGSARYFTSADLASGFHQLPIHPDHRKYTAFCAAGGLYEWTCLPEGVSNGPTKFQRVMDECLVNAQFKHFKKQFLSIYIDDVFIYSDTWEDHVKHLNWFLDTCSQYRISLKAAKSNFGVHEVRILGYYLSAGGEIRLGHEKLKGIYLMPTPETYNDLHHYVGLLNYYRGFIDNFATMAFPFYELMKQESKSKEFKWNEECDKARRQFCEILTSPPILHVPDYDLPFIIQTDASYKGIGAVLSQKAKSDNKEHPIAFRSRTLNDAEVNYSVPELECLAIVWAVEKFQPFIVMSKFEIYTDQRALKWLLTMLDSSNRRLARWALKLSEHSFNIYHREGRLNGNADTLSRLPEPVPGSKAYERHVNKLKAYEDYKKIEINSVLEWKAVEMGNLIAATVNKNKARNQINLIKLGKYPHNKLPYNNSQCSNLHVNCISVGLEESNKEDEENFKLITERIKQIEISKEQKRIKQENKLKEGKIMNLKKSRPLPVLNEANYKRIEKDERFFGPYREGVAPPFKVVYSGEKVRPEVSVDEMETEESINQSSSSSSSSSSMNSTSIANSSSSNLSASNLMSDSDNTHENNSLVTNSSSSASSLNSSISSQEFLRDGNQSEIELSSLFSDSEDDVESASVVNQGELRNIIEKRKDYKKIHINGQELLIPDRNKQSSAYFSLDPFDELHPFDTYGDVSISNEQLIDGQESDEFCEPFIKFLRDHQLPVDAVKSAAIRRQAQKFTYDSSSKLLCRKLGTVKMEASENNSTQTMSTVVPVIPRVFQQRILELFHCSLFGGHLGHTKTFHRIRAVCWWQTLFEDLQTFINNCMTCQTYKKRSRNYSDPRGVAPAPSRPFQNIAMDICGPFPSSDDGFTHILVIVDLFSRWTILLPCSNPTANDIARLLCRYVIFVYGPPEFIHSDRASYFTSNELIMALAACGCKKTQTAAYNPQGNGSSERRVQTVKEMLAVLINNNSEFIRFWPKLLSPIQYSFNTADAEDCDASPYWIVFGLPPPQNKSLIPSIGNDNIYPDNEMKGTNYLDVMVHSMDKTRKFIAEQLQIRRDKWLSENKDKNYHIYEVNDLVWINAQTFFPKGLRVNPDDVNPPPSSFRPRWIGPFKITERFSPFIYRIQSQPELPYHGIMNVPRVIHSKYIRLYRFNNPNKEESDEKVEMESS